MKIKLYTQMLSEFCVMTDANYLTNFAYFTTENLFHVALTSP